MSLKDYTAECGCVIEMNITHDWESGVTDAEDISIVTACEKHRPTPLAPDAGESAASQALSTPDMFSAIEHEPTPAPRR